LPVRRQSPLRLDQQAKAGLDLFDPVVDPRFKPGGEFLEAAVEVGIALDLRLQDLDVLEQMLEWSVHRRLCPSVLGRELAIRNQHFGSGDLAGVMSVDRVCLAAEFAQPAQDCRRALRFGLIDIRTS
jgi:hypothetical protein